MRQAQEISRRAVVAGAAAAAATTLVPEALAEKAEKAKDDVSALIAKPPAGFKPMTSRGRIVKVTKGGDFASLMQKNQLWPKPEVAKAMLEKALTTFTGQKDIASSLAKFIHKDDVVAVKVNGIAGQSGGTMAVNFELILPVVEGLIAMGVPADKIVVYEQFGSYMRGTRIGVKGNKLPAGVKTVVHSNGDAKMKAITVFEKVKTKYVRPFTDATAVIDMTQIKDHSICGFTGCLKNITHGSIINPQDHHRNQANPQIAVLYNHPIVTSRVRLHIVDAFKIIYEKGPLDKDPKRRIPHGAVYVATDPVAMDTMGWHVIDQARKDNKLKSLAGAGREPKYIEKAAELGLGERDMNKIKMKEVSA